MTQDDFYEILLGEKLTHLNAVVNVGGFKMLVYAYMKREGLNFLLARISNSFVFAQDMSYYSISLALPEITNLPKEAWYKYYNVNKLTNLITENEITLQDLVNSI